MWKSFFFVFSAFVAFAGVIPAEAAPLVNDIRLGKHPERVRLVIEASEKLDISTFALGDPYRLVVDLPEVDWQVDAASGAKGVAFVSGYRFGHFAPGRSRVVFDLARPAVISKSFAIAPRDGKRWRFVIDLTPATAREFAARLARPQPPEPGGRSGGRAVLVPVPRPLTRSTEKVVVIDPGHGGIDPGTIGRSKGVFEKHVTLAMSKRLRRELLNRGRYRVVLTRDRDIFLRLRARMDMARAAGADLFISLHADSISNSRISGASVYTLSEKASDQEAADLAAKENKADLIAGIDLTHETDEVTNILIDLAQRETMNHSAQFARVLVGEMRDTTRFLRKPHRFAGFAVLKSPDVPSVLIEMGYLSNPKDERNLTKPSYRSRLAKAIADAIDNYFVIRARAAAH